VPFVQHAVTKLAALWNSKTQNNSGLGATFRRWNPESSPTLEMQRHVWELVFRDSQKLNDKWRIDEVGMSEDLATLVERASIVIALRAASGERETPSRSDEEGISGDTSTEAVDQATEDEGRKKRQRTLGHALHDAELSDLRLMRLLTTSHELRMRELHRAMRYIARKRTGFDWSIDETRRILYFLFGFEEQAERSVDRWAQDFFASRSRSAAAEEGAAAETANQE
jgi:hypothetical protein